MMNEQQTETQTRTSFSWEAWAKDGIEGMKRTAVEFGVPREFFDHACAAQREAWAACQVLIGQFTEMVQKVTKMGKPSARPSQKIEVQ